MEIKHRNVFKLLYSFLCGLLYSHKSSLDNGNSLLTLVSALHMSLEDSIKWLGEVMAEIGPNHSQKSEDFHVFEVKEANAIIDYLKIR
jgi:hypothetical protein